MDGYSQMGRFRNVRNKYPWKEYTVEVDRTTYPHGSCYEVEIESTDPAKAKERMCVIVGCLMAYFIFTNLRSMYIHKQTINPCATWIA